MVTFTRVSSEAVPWGVSGWWCCQGVDAIIQCKIVVSRLRNASKTTSKIKSVEQQNYWTGSMVRCWERGGGGYLRGGVRVGWRRWFG